MSFFPWNDDQIAQLKEWWKDGQSAGVIAKRLSTSRNSVIGKVHRLGLEKRKSACRVIRIANLRGPVRRKGRWANSHAPAPMFSAEPLPPEPPMPMTALRLTLMQITDHTCKCGLGDPKEPDFAFCGLPVRTGSPYCPMHHALMYTPNRKPKERKSRVQPPVFDAAAELYERLLAA